MLVHLKPHIPISVDPHEISDARLPLSDQLALEVACGLLERGQPHRTVSTIREHRLLNTPLRRTSFVIPDDGTMHHGLKRKGMTLMLLWDEPVSQHTEERTHSYSQFCENYRRYALRLKRFMRQNHRADD